MNGEQDRCRDVCRHKINIERIMIQSVERNYCLMMLNLLESVAPCFDPPAHCSYFGCSFLLDDLTASDLIAFALLHALQNLSTLQALFACFVSTHPFLFSPPCPELPLERLPKPPLEELSPLHPPQAPAYYLGIDLEVSLAPNPQSHHLCRAAG